MMKYKKPCIDEAGRIPRQILGLFDDASFRLMLEIGNVFYLFDTYLIGDWPRADFEPAEWLEAVIEINPGLWTAEICRIKHNVPSNRAGIAYCGLCREYANPRKRQRSANLPAELPGFEEQGGAFRLHEPCSRKALTWLRKTTDRWAKQGLVEKQSGSVIPDMRQARGWDYGTRIFPTEG